jgi:hypothetical protein
MPHVLRTPEGQILSLHRQPVAGSEFLSADHPEVRVFLGQDEPGTPDFARMDAGLIRVIEDVVDVLVARNIIRITDLPLEAQHKLFDRKGFRDRFRRNALQLFADPPAAGGGEGASFMVPRDTL